MSTHKTYINGRPIVATGGSNAAGFPAVTVMQNTFDASKRPLAAGDVAEVLHVPAGTFVHKVFVHVMGAESGENINVGDGDDTDGYVANASVGTEGARVMGAGDYAAGKFYAEEDTIDIHMPTGKSIEVAHVRVVAVVAAIG